MTDDAGKIEQSLRHAARDAALASLARDAAHDLKGVLNVITMNVELLSRYAQNPASYPLTAEQAARCVDVLHRKLRQLDRSLDGLLGSRHADVDAPGRIDLVDLCHRQLELIAARATRQNVEVSFTSAGPVMVTGFVDRLQSAVLALLVNALDAMPRGGRLDVTVAGTPAPSVRISDSGAGVAPEWRDEIWRLHFTTKPDGTGLGLPVARAIVEGHGGTISHHANSDGGSTFAIELAHAVSS